MYIGKAEGQAEIFINRERQQKNLIDFDDRIVLGHKIKDLYCICCSSGKIDPHKHVKTKEQENTTSQHHCMNWLLTRLYVNEIALNPSNIDDEIFLINPQEACFMVGNVSLPITSTGNNVNLVSGCFKYSENRYRGINVITWPEYFFAGIALTLEDIRVMQSATPTKVFICQNRKSKPARTVMIDALIESGLITDAGDKYNSEVGHASYIWAGKLLDSGQDGGWEHHSYYEDALIDVFVETECSNDTIRFTEKTTRPILIGKPFLILSGVGTHRILFDHYGFKPYPFLDYSFDDIEDIHERATHIANQLKKISVGDVEELWNMSRPIAKYNRRRMFDILLNSNPPVDLGNSYIISEWKQRKHELLEVMGVHE